MIQRFKRNKPAIAGLIVLILAVFIAIFGYLLVPDPTPDANEQILEIATSNPGFEIDMLHHRKNREVKKSNIFSRIIGGRENPYQMRPITAYAIQGDSIFVDGYTGEGRSPEKLAFHLADIVYPVVDNGIIPGMVRTLDGENINFTVADLATKVEKEHIKKHTYRLGTDKFGRDNLSRLILGVRVSISVGLLAALISLVIGVTMGSFAGFYRKNPPNVSYWVLLAVPLAFVVSWALFKVDSSLIRVLGLFGLPLFIFLIYKLLVNSLGRIFNPEFKFPVDDIIMWFINVFWSIPLLLLVFALVLALGREFWQIFLAVGLTMWVEIARIVRGQFMSLREKEFVEASESLGYSNARTIFRHILPNCIGPIIVITAANFATAIIIEAGLSFLGIGVQPPKPSWGIMLNEYYQYIGSSKSFLAIIPGLAIMVLVLAFNLIGNGLRDAFDVKTK